MFILEIYIQIAESILETTRSLVQFCRDQFKLENQIRIALDDQTQYFDLFGKESPLKIDEKLFEGLALIGDEHNPDNSDQ
ncbi:MAG TPA: hypothetical protein QKA08_00310 [Candidatus Megaira endosymbiont of Nemacystus decipiens]|nr:hypothetical protein [Candidatus Megaera endosymbiont of Nemacystus decipiens]